MLKIKGTTITLTRGDSLEVQIKIKQKNNDNLYKPSQGDEIRFALKRSYRDPEPLIYKIIPNDTLILKLSPAETKQLIARTTPYVYDIQLTTVTGMVDTFIDQALFYITEEVD